MKKIIAGIFTAVLVFLSGCASTQPVDENKITLGTVQKKIEIGMSGAEVVQALGSPNMVTTDDERREVWVYDKISSEVSRTSSGAGFSLLIVGAGNSNDKITKTQKTMTIIIKFNENQKVRDFAYHSSQF